jgi:hypothetical protein
VSLILAIKDRKRKGEGMIGERNVTLPNCVLTDYLVWSWVCVSVVILGGSSAVEAS